MGDNNLIREKVEYFFHFAEACLDSAGEGHKVRMGMGEVHDFREEYKRINEIDFGLWKFTKIEALATSFVNQHLKNKTTFLIGAAMMSGEVDMNQAIVLEVKGVLETDT